MWLKIQNNYSSRNNDIDTSLFNGYEQLYGLSEWISCAIFWKLAWIVKCHAKICVWLTRHQKSLSLCRFWTPDGPLEVVLVVPEVELVNVLACFRDKDQLYEYYFHYSPADAYFVNVLHSVQNYLVHFQILSWI